MKYLKSAAAMIALLAATAAQADTVQLKYDGNGPVLATWVSIDNVAKNIYVGSYNLSIEGQASSFAAYCVDPFQNNATSFTAYDRSPPTTSPWSVPSASAT